ncbi:MAG: hypothetical protein PHS93_07795 [Candidatus Omnitrophica bacterium]|nr:hypothetical protein [Candidatus Omnitrophota bacterium]
MKIIKTFKGEDGFEELTLVEAVEYLEHRGYYDKGTVVKIIQSGIKTTLQTDFAIYDFC